MPNRRQLNQVVGQMQRATAHDRGIGTIKTRLNDPDQAEQMLDVLFGFEAFQEESPVNDPFAGLSEPEAPTPQTLTGSQFVDGLDEPDAPGPMPSIGEIATGVIARTPFFSIDAAFDGASRPVGAPDLDEASTPVRFPVLVAGVNAVNLGDLQAPAQRVAEIVEALEPVLAPPPVVRDLEALVLKANALEVTDAASYAAGTELYELLAANEKGIEETISPVVSFFHRPWQAMCQFRARYAKPVAEAKKRLSDVCGAWKLAADKAAQVEAQRAADQTAADERARLLEIAAAASAAAEAAPAESPVRQVLEQTATQATEQSRHCISTGVGRVTAATPATSTNGRKTYEAVVSDEDKFYQSLVDDKTRRVAAPIDFAYLNRQAKDLGSDLANRFPGIEAREKGGLSAKGKR